MEERYLAIYDYLQESVNNNEMDEDIANAILEEAYDRYINTYTVEEALDDIENAIYETESESEENKEEIKEEEIKFYSGMVKETIEEIKENLKKTKKSIRNKDKNKAKLYLAQSKKSIDKLELVIKRFPDKVPKNYYDSLSATLMKISAFITGFSLLSTKNNIDQANINKSNIIRIKGELNDPLDSYTPESNKKRKEILEQEIKYKKKHDKAIALNIGKIVAANVGSAVVVHRSSLEYQIKKIKESISKLEDMIKEM